MTNGNGRIRLGVGEKYYWDGDIAEIRSIDADGITVHLRAGKRANVSVREFLSLDPSPVTPNGTPAAPDRRGSEDDPNLYAAMLSQLTPKERREVEIRAEHVREILFGYKDGDEEHARPGEPRADYDSTPMKHRVQTKATELDRGVRTINYWVADFKRAGLYGLLDKRGQRSDRLLTRIDQRWLDTANAVIDEGTDMSRTSMAHTIKVIEARLRIAYPNTFQKPDTAQPTTADEQPCAEVDGAVGATQPAEAADGALRDDAPMRLPGRSTAYRVLNELSRHRNVFDGSAKGRRSIATSPQGVHGRAHVSRLGEFVILDTTPLDVFAMDRLTNEWVRVELTVALDQYTRAVTGLRLTPLSSRSVDAASVLYDSIRPTPAPSSWLDGVGWPYLGLPQNLLIPRSKVDFGGRNGKPAVRLASFPTVAPEAVRLDHGKMYVSEHFRAVCQRLGISIQLARPFTGSDKAWLERFFGSIRTLLEKLPGYKGSSVYERGAQVEADSFYFIDELEAILREWIATGYHRQPHDGLVEPGFPGLDLSPLEMVEHSVAQCGYIEIPARQDLVFDFLPETWRRIGDGSVNIDTLKYNGAAINPYRHIRSGYHVQNGKWPFRYDPSDISRIWFRDPDTSEWHPLMWEWAHRLRQPFSVDALAHAKRLAAAKGPDGNYVFELDEMLDRWGSGVGVTREERLGALRHSRQQREAIGPSRDLPPSDWDGDYEQPLSAAAGTAGVAISRRPRRRPATSRGGAAAFASPAIASTPEHEPPDADWDDDLDEDETLVDDEYYTDAMRTSE